MPGDEPDILTLFLFDYLKAKMYLFFSLSNETSLTENFSSVPLSAPPPLGNETAGACD